MLSRIRESYGIKLLIGYAITGSIVTVVGVTTGSVAATITMAWAGLLALGSITGTSTIASVTELRKRTGAIADGELGTHLPSNRDDELGDLFRAVDTMRWSLSDEIDNATELREEAEQARSEADELVEEYREIADQYAATMQAASDGDLTQRVDVDDRHEPMALIGDAFNRMLDDLEATLRSVEAFAGRIESDTRTLESLSDDAESEVEAAVAAATEITEATSTQRRQLDATADEIEDASATAEEIAATTETLASTSSDAATATGEAQQAAEEAIAQMEAIENETVATVEQIESLTETTEEITEIAGVINEIANQTNILALNANVVGA
ncbi:sensory rhodopsin I transducer transmembrane region [Natronomonas moolapensis 8.8.11]|uniref:Sensory rhodopsin I transducer transmembrane region n=1 Tax=Natronomonas moolapensis (strain DSM 18674 / CECT 7526 / JCM 14361 / 8.8.11) TaxID=268739 RepID=M1XP74_NATM8|nr:methyl-accepting chemotaxis protein [Natronomonas moolapensis]CCQ35819.1 sensory rhodopsin I transducer transmembrane region [Natronomonas moolapensis 8.8.11]